MPAGDKQVTVRAGDTAGKIAAQNKSPSVSLDQMLVAMLRSNPDAFIGGNVNRLKAGAVLDMPTAETASTIDAGEASRTIVAQSQDFNAFRRKLAAGAPTTQVGEADRQAGGRVQAKVEDRAPAGATPDKLTLSKGAVQGRSAAEDQIAKDRQAKDAATRVAELSKNISDLNKLTAPSPAAPAPTTAPVAAPAAAAPAPAATSAAPGLPVPVAAAPAPVVTPAPAASAPTASPAPVPAAAASEPVVSVPTPAPTASAAPATAAPQPSATASAAAPVAAKKPAPAPLPEPSLLDDLLENPLLLPVGAAILLLLGGLIFYRYRKHNNSAQVDSSFLESRLQPDSFFGASGGQRIDTSEGAATGSSLVYSPSQLDAAGDVDPVAEADVYLAYGRDLQAEEILKEAMRTTPSRVAIYTKLLEIYAKRHDGKAFESVATQAFQITQGNGPEWAYITEMGRELDAANALYQPGGRPDGAGKSFNPAATVAIVPPAMAPVASQPAAPASAVDVDLDLDFSLGDDEPDTAASPMSGAAPLSPSAMASMAAAAPAMPLVAAPPRAPAPAPAASIPPAPVLQAPAPVAAAPAVLPDLEFPTDGLDFKPEPIAKPVVAKAPAPAPAPAPAAADSGMLEFDLGSLSLDLGPTTESPAQNAAAASSDPLETKFQLAEEFRVLGDPDGARSLAEEVVAEATGPLKVKAQAFLNGLS